MAANINESGVFIMEPISDRVIEQLKCGEMGQAAFMPSSDRSFSSQLLVGSGSTVMQAAIT